MAEAADAAFRSFQETWSGKLPPSAEIAHVGATAVSGCLTKGDLDICIRIEARDFAQAEADLARSFERNAGSVRNAAFAAFKENTGTPPLGVQLVAKCSELDVFVDFRDWLRCNPSLLAAYNDLKSRYAGQPMEEYRRAKSMFIAQALARKS